MEFNALDTATKAEEGIEFEIMSPATGKGMGAFLTIKGADSKAYKKAHKEAMKRASDETTMEDVASEVAISCATGWRGLTEGGVEMRFSEDSLRRLFASSPTVRDQAIAVQKSRARFLASGSAS